MAHGIFMSGSWKRDQWMSEIFSNVCNYPTKFIKKKVHLDFFAIDQK